MQGSEISYNRALVTGATSGIGEALCHLLADKKINLLIAGRKVVRLNALAEELRKKVDVHVFPGDLAVPEERKQLIDNIAYYLPDLIVNNAGAGLYGDALMYETAQQMKIFEIDAEALLEITLESARILVSAKKKGVILNVSSVTGFITLPGFSVYSASKAFVNRFSMAFDEEMKPYGIRVLTSCPGVVETNFRMTASGKKKSQYTKWAMSPTYAAEEIWKQIVSKKQLDVFDWKYRLLLVLLKFIPNSFLRGFFHKHMLNRIDKRTILTR